MGMKLPEMCFHGPPTVNCNKHVGLAQTCWFGPTQTPSVGPNQHVRAEIWPNTTSRYHFGGVDNMLICDTVRTSSKTPPTGNETADRPRWRLRLPQLLRRRSQYTNVGAPTVFRCRNAMLAFHSRTTGRRGGLDDTPFLR